MANCEHDLWEDAATHLRSLLAVAPQEVYDEAVAALTLFSDLPLVTRSELIRSLRALGDHPGRGS